VKLSETIFVSDLHLTEARPETVSRFLAFLQRRAPQSERLCILGDLFDAYLGDDDRSVPYGAIRQQLKALTASGTEVLLQVGNRDFLIGQNFSAETGAQLLGDYHSIDLYGTPTLLMHGDLLCTDDVKYLAARARVRTPEWRAYALGKPLWMRRLYARWYRFRSGRDKKDKTDEIMDANPGAIAEAMTSHHVTRLIHGHTHRPGCYPVEILGKPSERHVLPEWNGQEWLLIVDAEGIRHESLSADDPGHLPS
jgi:UDP-2,3-diacylglucosamine hydrolase